FQELRQISFKIISDMKIKGHCTVKFALSDKSWEYSIIDISPYNSQLKAFSQVTRGIDIEAIKEQLAQGELLKDIKNERTGLSILSESTYTYLSLFYDEDRFVSARNMESAFLKVARLLTGNEKQAIMSNTAELTDDELYQKLVKGSTNQIIILLEALRRGFSVEELYGLTKINSLFLDKFQHIVEIEEELKINVFDPQLLKEAKRYGLSDERIAEIWSNEWPEIRRRRLLDDILPSYKKADKQASNYYFTSYELRQELEESEEVKILILAERPDDKLPELIKNLKSLNIQIITLGQVIDEADKNYLEQGSLENLLDLIDYEGINQILILKEWEETEPLEELEIHVYGDGLFDLGREELRELFIQSEEKES
ncbi:MAG: hypothetical protein FWF14_04595, partial [Streptococcaceae bacterium]|nr:hypothetical protein [Streptococcaceae bacterium]